MHKEFIILNYFQDNTLGKFIAKALSGTLILNVATVALAFLLQLLLARLMGAEQLGWFMLGMAWISILSILCLCGFSVSVIRLYGEYTEKKYDALISGLLKRAVHIVLGASSFIALIGITGLFFINTPFTTEFNTLALAFAILPIWCFMILRQGMLRAFKMVVKAKIPENIIRPLGAIILCIFLYVIQDQTLSADQAMAMNALAVLIAILLSQKWFNQVRPHHLKDITPDYKTREWLKISLPMTLTTWIPAVLRRSDVIMIGWFIDAHAVGIYSVAVALSTVVQMAYNSVVNVVAPLYAEHHFKNDYKTTRKIYLMAMGTVGGLTLIGSAFMVFISPYILPIFGESFSQGHNAFLILLAGQMIGSLAGTPESYLGMSDRQNTLAKWFIVGVILNIALNIPLIQTYGIEGAALATAMTGIALKVIFSLNAYKQLFGRKQDVS